MLDTLHLCYGVTDNWVLDHLYEVSWCWKHNAIYLFIEQRPEIGSVKVGNSSTITEQFHSCILLVEVEEIGARAIVQR